MKLLLERNGFSSSATLGNLSIDGTAECFCLENPLGGQKPHKAIPPGTYTIEFTRSPKFSRPHGPRILPLLNGVLGFDSVRIHCGNTARDTEGCLLVGKSKGPDAVYESRKALAQLLLKMWRKRKEGVTITIS